MAALSDLEERMFVRMILTADDFGLGLASNLHATCFPVADIPKAEAARALANMATAGLIRLYRDASGRELFSIIKFGNKPRATSSKFYTWEECKHLACNLQTTCEQNHAECMPKPETKTGNREPETVTPFTPPSKRAAIVDDPDAGYPDEFLRIWNAWPQGKRGNKGAALKAWKKAKALRSVEFMLKSIEAHKAHDPKWWEGEYIPHASTWLNQRGFDTDPTPQTAPKRFDANGRELF